MIGFVLQIGQINRRFNGLIKLALSDIANNPHDLTRARRTRNSSARAGVRYGDMFPRGSSWGKYLRAASALMITTAGASRSSCKVKYLPLIRVAPIVLKKSELA